MGKKTTTTKAATPAKTAAKPSAKTKTPAAPAIVSAPVKPAPAKKAVPKPAAKRTAKPVAPKAPNAPGFTSEDIALRAYFLSEKRQAAGISGDSHQDWIEAERQLMAEAAPVKKPKGKARKS